MLGEQSVINIPIIEIIVPCVTKQITSSSIFYILCINSFILCKTKYKLSPCGTNNTDGSFTNYPPLGSPKFSVYDFPSQSPQFIAFNNGSSTTLSYGKFTDSLINAAVSRVLLNGLYNIFCTFLFLSSLPHNLA